MTKVLVVEDEQAILDLLRLTLRRRGYEVLSAYTGLDGILKARDHQPDLVLLDLMLHDIDGFTVCEILRDQPSTSSIPVIMVTALLGEMARLIGLDSGAADFITKPFHPKDLLERVEKVLESRRQQWQEMEREEARNQAVLRALRVAG